MRLNRLYPRSIVKAGLRTILVPRPSTARRGRHAHPGRGAAGVGPRGRRRGGRPTAGRPADERDEGEVVTRVARRRWRPARLSALAAAVWSLTGCGSVHPGAAAVVGRRGASPTPRSTTSPPRCARPTSSARRRRARPPRRCRPAGSARARCRSSSTTELNQQFGEAEGRRGEQAAGLAGGPAERAGHRDAARGPAGGLPTALAGYAEGQLMLIEVGREALGDADATDDAAFAEGTSLRGPYVAASTSRSTRASARSRTAPSSPAARLALGRRLQPARAGAARQPAGRADVATLPVSQKCS